ncbi:MAG: hypothetical protein JW807_13730 [Spirochaetes bacterium]|nr:hypothetical protein [Spirochaetota bacterium]
MVDKEEIKKIERRARALLTSKEIPPHKQEVVRSLMNNRRLKPGEKYRAVIELVESCPDKKVVLYDDTAVKPEPPAKKASPKKAGSRPQQPEVFGPTETSYYIDNLARTYAHLKLFRKRYFVHRNNRIGIGIRKRLVPSRNLVRVMNYLADLQGMITARLVTIMMAILDDPAAESPVIFNYIRTIRRWMSDMPLINIKYDAMKWMERAQFDRELRGWISGFFSFLMLEGEMRENITHEVETRLRAQDELRKEDFLDGEPALSRKEKEKRNLEKEKKIYEYMMFFRSFLPIDEKQETLLSKRLKHGYGIGGVAELMMTIAEALVFQRPIRLNELVAYYGIGAPFVNTAAWDYSEEYLAKVGKDAESFEKKKRESIRKELEPYETLALLLRHDDQGQNLMLKGVEDEWRYIDRRHYDPKIIYNENFTSFLETLVLYFRNLYVPLLDGSTIRFRDMGRQEIEGSIFSFNYFESQLTDFNRILDDMHFFKTGNPTLAVKREEIRRIMRDRSVTMAHVEKFIRSIGDCFYFIGKELQRVYDMHRRWTAGRSAPSANDPIREPIKDREGAEDRERARPIPYHDCVILELENSTALSREIIGRRVMEDSLYDGVFVRMTAFAYQVAYECMNERVARDLEERKALLKKIEDAPK